MGVTSGGGIPGGSSASTAFAENQLGAQVHNAEVEKRDGAQPDDVKAKGKGKGEQTQETGDGTKAQSGGGARGFSAVDAVELAATSTAMGELGQFVLVGAEVNAHAAATQQATISPEAMTALAQLVSVLADPDGAKVGAAFSPPLPDGVAGPVSFPTDFAFLSVSAQPTEADASKPDAANASRIDNRVKVIRAYQNVIAKLFDKQTESLGQANFANLPPEAQKLLQSAVQRVQQAAAASLGQPFGGQSVFKGKQGNEVFDSFRSMLEECEGQPTSEQEIQIPGPAIVALEEAAQFIRQAAGVIQRSVTAVDAKKSGPGESAAKAGESGGSAGSASLDVSIPGFGSPSGASATQGAPLGKIDGSLFKSGDIEALATMVMMEGVNVNDDILRGIFLEMSDMNKAKEQLQKLATQAKQSSARLDREMQQEYNALKARGDIHPTITFDQYKTWRQCSFAAMQETTNADGTHAYALAEPQLSKPSPMDDPSMIPDWIKTGNVEQVNQASDKDISMNFGLPPVVMQALKKVFNALKLTDGTTFQDWLQNTVGCMQVFEIDDITANMTMVQQFLAMSPENMVPKVGSVDAIDQVNQTKLQDLENKWTALVKAKTLNAAFPGLISDSVIADLESQFKAARMGPGLDAATAAEFNRWEANEGLTEAKEYQDHIDEYIADHNDPANWQVSGNAYLATDGDASTASFASGNSYDSDRVGHKMSEDGGSHSINSHFGDSGLEWSTPSKDVTQEDGFWSTNNSWRISYSYNGPTRNYDGANFADTLNADLKSFASTGNVDVTAHKDAISLDQFASAGYQGIADPGLKKADPNADRNAIVAAVTAALGDANSVLSSMGDPTDPTSDWGDWARRNGFDTEWNKAQAAHDAAEGGPKSMQGDNAQVDESTGLVLDRMGGIAEFEAFAEEIKNKIDTISGMSDMVSLRIQKYMDSRSKMYEVLSTLLKKGSTTSETINKNI